MSNQARRAFRHTEAYRRSRNYLRREDECQEHTWSPPVNGMQECLGCEAKRREPRKQP